MNFSIPNSLKETYSCKGCTLITLESIKQTLNTDHGVNSQVLLLTSYGFIKCDIDFETSSKSPIKESNIENKGGLDLTCISNFRNILINNLEEETPGIQSKDNGAILNLKNVTIFSSGLSSTLAHPTVTIDEFVIFADQIIGFSLIPCTVEE